MTTAEPTFSVVVNTIDRAKQLTTLLAALNHQTYPHFEVVVVVGPTKDNTLEVLATYGERVRVVGCPEANQGLARNIGILASHGDIVAYIDDDAVPCNRWLEQMARLFADPQLDGTGGSVFCVYPQDPRIQHRDGIMSSLAEQFDVRASRLEHLVEPSEGVQWFERMMGTNMAFRRRALLDIGGFDTFYVYLADECDVALRMVHAGKVLRPVRELPVYHLPASSRNRVVFTFIGRWWWMETRSKTYYCITNGARAGDPPRAIATRCLHLVHGHMLHYKNLALAGQLPKGRAAVMALNEVRGAATAAVAGLTRRPGLIAPEEAKTAMNSAAPIQPFQNAESRCQPAVDPTGGPSPRITLPEPPLRICLLSNEYPPTAYEGVGRLTNLMARGLFELGHSVHVVTLGDREQISFYDGAYVHRIKYSLDRYQQFRQYPKLIHALNYGHAVYEKARSLVLNDGVEVVDSPLWIFPGLVTAISGLLPVVVRLITAQRQVGAIQQDDSHDSAIMGDMEQALIKRAAHLLPNSRATVAALEKVYNLHIPPERMTLIPYGLVPAADEEVRPFDPARSGQELTVLYVGRLEKRKGTRALFDAIPAVLERVPNARFLFVGADNSQSDGFAQETGMTYPDYFAKHYPALRDRVTFVGAVSDDELQRYYQQCDLFVAPSIYESFGLVFIEAMNYAKPVIGCRAGGMTDVIDEGVTGWLAEPDDSRSLAAALIAALSNPAQLRERGLAGRQRLLDRFTYVQMARQFAKVYARVARQKSLFAETEMGGVHVAASDER